MHTALVARQSEYFNVAVNDDKYREACDGQLVLNDVDEDTFIRFTQFAYTGDYTVDHALPPDSGSALPDTASEGENSLISKGASSKHKGKKAKRKTPTKFEMIPAPSPGSYYLVEDLSKREQVWHEFQNAVKGLPRTDPQSRNKTSADEYRAGVLLCHARLHIFADLTLVSGLRDLALYKLGQALVALELSDDRVEDVVTLLRYCYENPSPEDLKAPLVLYTACNVEKLWQRPSFQGLLLEYGELSKALVGSMLPRLD